MRRAVVITLLLLAAAPAAAEPVPSGRLSILLGLRDGTGKLDDDFGFGGLYGIEASWEPMRVGQPIGYAINWSVLFGTYGADAAAITGELDTLEMNFGVRVRLAPVTPSRSLFLGGGATLLRSSSPLPPDDRRDYVGGYVGAGGEALWKGLLFTAEARFGLIGAGPGSVSVLLGVGKGV